MDGDARSAWLWRAGIVVGGLVEKRFFIFLLNFSDCFSFPCVWSYLVRG